MDFVEQPVTELHQEIMIQEKTAIRVVKPVRDCEIQIREQKEKQHRSQKCKKRPMSVEIVS
jgi:hypothetical protein